MNLTRLLTVTISFANYFSIPGNSLLNLLLTFIIIFMRGNVSWNRYEIFKMGKLSRKIAFEVFQSSVMVLCSLVFIFCLGMTEVLSVKRCHSLKSPPKGRVSCFLGNESVSCSHSFAETFAEFSCRDFYKLSQEEGRIVKCLSNGRWSSPPPKCVPDCGRRSNSVSLILNAEAVTRGAYPWHVAMYYSLEGAYEFWCGGSLVSETAVITAAHCVWKVSPEKVIMAFGKFHREYNYSENDVQKITAKKIEILKSYQDVNGNYNGDIAVVFLERAVTLGHYAAPVCLDWNQELVEQHLMEQNMGVVLGWGLTENDTFSDYLRMVKLPVVSHEKCIAEQERDFQKFITYTSFCAGYNNGTGVCNGDSGGGLTFFDEDTGRWYLQGVVSVSPRRKDAPYCDPSFYTVFTKVGAFSKWLRRMTEFAGVVAAYESTLAEYQKKSRTLKNKQPPFKNFSHTIKMLQLAGLYKSHNFSSTEKRLIESP